MMLQTLKQLCDNCTLCYLGRDLQEVRNQKIDPHVFSNMNMSRYVVIGQNPGFNECLKDEPFVGDAGQTFDAEIAKHGLTRKQFYITNILHCYTPKNRQPLPEELVACRPMVQMELAILNPNLIITLGKFAFNALCPEENYRESLGNVKKAMFGGKKLNIFPIYHPSGMNLSQKTRKLKFEKDIALMCKLINVQINQSLVR
jgi:uracil-DNA glycosylase